MQSRILSISFLLLGPYVAQYAANRLRAENPPIRQVAGMGKSNPSPLAAEHDGNNPGIDRLLGQSGRANHEKQLAAMSFDGKTYPWQTYSRWGRQLFHDGQVSDPPTGPAPSPLLSKFYRCTHCHNNQREDVVLTIQDPEARAELIERQPAATSANAVPLFLATGTTLWGAVNRESFYNDSFQIYHALTVPGDREMDPTSLEDATQVCCRYCSIGRFAEPWELASLLAYFWDLEVRINDLDLPADVEKVVLTTLQPGEATTGDVKKQKQMRAFLRRLYLLKAGDRGTAPPTIENDGAAAVYPDELQFAGDAKIGQRLFHAACERCHTDPKICDINGRILIEDEPHFHKILSKGTQQDDVPYMPMFTAERLSRQQIADIAAWLRSLE